MTKKVKKQQGDIHKTIASPPEALTPLLVALRQLIADSLYRGIARYVNGLSGVKVASKISREERSN